jgi:tetratricopeptide (TPR) repeat protein
LLLAVGLVFGPSIGYRFVNLDDIECVRENPFVNHGLTLSGVKWAFTHSHANTWAPLTWLSHMLDCQIYGLNPWGHHLTNVLLHATTTVVLFLVLRSMTGRLWASALVAAFFGLHPLQAESVAWVAERKGLLAGLCFTLTLAAYLRYSRRPFSLMRYLAVFVALALGLMAKPIVVTLPLLLLLLDYWPLGRMNAKPRSSIAPAAGRSSIARSAGRSSVARSVTSPSSIATQSRSTIAAWWRLILEKVPLLALVAVACWVAVWAQGEALAPNGFLPLPWRIGNALVSYGTYLGNFFWPAGLTVLYPHPALMFSAEKALYGLAPGKIAAGLLALAVGTIAAVGLRRRCPWLLVGWLWYLGMMLPMIGLVQFGVQSMADRFTYLPQIGLWLALVWTLAVRRIGNPSDGVRRIANPSDAADGALAGTGMDGRRAVGGRPRHARWAWSAGAVLALTVLAACAWRQASFWRDTETLLTRAIDCTPRNYAAHTNLGLTLALEGRFDEAMDHYRKALDISPNVPEAHNALGLALAAGGRFDEAIAEYQAALKLADNPVIRDNLGRALASAGRFEAAVAQYGRLVEIEPQSAPAESRLAWLLATAPVRGARNGAEAVRHAENAVRLSGGEPPEALSTLAAAYAEAGRFPDAVRTARHALELALKLAKQPLADSLRRQLALYEAGKPFHLPMPRAQRQPGANRPR